MVEITTSGVTNSDSDILVDEGQSVEVCVSVSGATISEREVVVYALLLANCWPMRPASKYITTLALHACQYNYAVIHN